MLELCWIELNYARSTTSIYYANMASLVYTIQSSIHHYISFIKF